MDVNLNQNVSYSFIIEDKTGGGSGRQIKPPSAPTSDGMSKKESRQIKTLAKSAPLQALKFADMLITAEINRVELRTGLTTLQQQIKWKKQTATQIGTAAVAIGMGIATQNYVAVVGGLISLVSMGIRYGIAEQDLLIERAVADVGIGMANIRAGTGGDRNSRATY
jgi:hypothetical protein